MHVTDTEVWVAYSAFGLELLFMGFIFLAWLFSSQVLESLYDKYDTGLPVTTICLCLYMASKIAMYVGISFGSPNDVEQLMYILMWFDAAIFSILIAISAIVWLPDLREYIADKRGL